MEDSLVSINSNEVILWIGCQFTVEIAGSYHGFFVGGQSTGSILDDGKNFCHSIVEGFLIDVEHFLLQLIYLIEDIFTFINRCILDGSLELFDFCLLLIG